MSDERERLPLKDEMRMTVEEARMVLPGIQALFGFQLIAVFNQRFTELSLQGQRLHLGSMVFVMLAIALVMAPAAYHRIAERGWVTRHFLNISSNQLSWAMGMLMLGIALELALIVRLVLDNIGWGACAALAVVVVLGATWFVLPILHRRQHEPPLPTGAHAVQGKRAAR